MAKEQRLIDAKAFDLRVHQKSMLEVFPNWGELPKETQDMICKHGHHLHMLLETQATVDAVEVVRCKDCKQWRRNVGIVDSPNGHCFCHDIETNGNDFCSYGERRTDV